MDGPASTLTPVKLPPGCARLSAIPVLTGSPVIATMGIRDASFLKMTAPGPTTKMTSGLLRTTSVARASGCHSTERHAPIKKPSDASPCLKESNVQLGDALAPERVRSGSDSDVSAFPAHVSFAPMDGHRQLDPLRPKSVESRCGAVD